MYNVYILQCVQCIHTTVDGWMAVRIKYIQCTVYSVQCTVYSVQCTVLSVQCVVYSLQCTMLSDGCKDGGCREVGKKQGGGML